MVFVDSGVPCQPTSNIPTDEHRGMHFSKKLLIQIGISIASIAIFAVAISVFIYLFTKRQSSQINTSITLDNILTTTTTFQNISATTTTFYHVSTTDDPKIKAGQQFGDVSGAAFDDSLTENFTSSYYLSGIINRRDSICLDWIQCFYTSANHPENVIQGVTHGIRETTDVGEQFFLDKDEKISKVQVKVDNIQLYVNGAPSIKPKLIIAIRFFTTKGRSSPDIDQVKGDNYIEEFEGYTLGYLSGRSGRYLDQFQFYWYRTITN